MLIIPSRIKLMYNAFEQGHDLHLHYVHSSIQTLQLHYIYPTWCLYVHAHFLPHANIIKSVQLTTTLDKQVA